VRKERLSLNELLRRSHIEWHGVKVGQPDWSDHSRALAFTLRSLDGGFRLHGILNAYWEPLTFELPAVAQEHAEFWRRCIDTALESPDDIRPWAQAPLVKQRHCEAQARSLVVLALALQETPNKISKTK
jgi:glycogen operon protein